MVQILKKTVIVVVLPCLAVLYSGCQLASILVSPNSHEIKIPAEYDLSMSKDQKILVLVNQPAWINSSTNLPYYVTQAVNYSLAENVNIPTKNLISYEQLSNIRAEKPDLFTRGAVDVGREMKMDKVLLIVIEDFQLYQADNPDYYKGSLNTQAFIFDCATGQRVWPSTPLLSKAVRVGFELEKGGAESAVKRLASALAHCTTRFLYDCRKTNFRIGDDRTESAWNKWDN